MNNKGFTLIELLVVIAIIGILSGIVLTALSGARDKAKDAQVQADLSGFRTAAELVYSNNNSYDGICETTTAETKPYLDGITNADVDITKCVSSTDTYVFEVELPSEEGGPWCVDSTGFSGKDATYNNGVCAAPAA
mgnify:CR=1 FL=1